MRGLPKSLFMLSLWFNAPCRRGIEYAHRFPAYRMRCPDGSAFTTPWQYAGLLCNLYRDTGPKPCHRFQTLVLNPHLTAFTHSATCCWLGCTIPPQSAFPSSQIPLYSSPLSLPPLRERELEAIIIIKFDTLVNNFNSPDFKKAGQFLGI